jgi:signal transduction histidine kinase
MSKIYFLSLLNVLIIPLLIFPQMKIFDELIKADIIKISSEFKSQINFNKACFFLVKKNRNSTFMNSKKESKSDVPLFKSLNLRKMDAKRLFRLYSDFALLLKDFCNTQNVVGAITVIENNYDDVLNQKEINTLKAENESKQSQRNDFLYLVIALSLLLIGGGFVYNKHVKGTNMILLQKSKLNELNDTKDKLLTIICHDLRSSVYALKDSNAKLTASLENKNYDELDQLLHKNHTIANGAYSLLDNILHWALLQTKQLYFHKDSIHLFSVVQQIEYNYRPLFAEKALVFENSVSENCFIYVDIDSLKIVLRNLFDNAIKFSNKNGKISIYTQETDSNFCKLIIEDSGSGIDQNSITELLKDSDLLCKKNDSASIGTGLGLQLCKMMIQRNGGMLAIESELNKGTKMIISFPKTEQNG